MKDNLITREEAQLLLIALDNSQERITNYIRQLMLEIGEYRAKLKYVALGKEKPNEVLINQKVIADNEEIWNKLSLLEHKIKNIYNIE